MTKAISILGCTGSIGRQSIAAAEHLGLPVAAMTVNKKADKAEEYARCLKPRFVAAYDEEAAKELPENSGINAYNGASHKACGHRHKGR